MGHTVGSSDRDGNGDLDIDESRLLEDDARDLLKQIQRGNVLSAIEEREKHAAGYTAAEFIAELDGLDHDEVFELAGRPSEELYLEHRQQARNWDPSVDLCEIILPGAAGGAVAGAVPIAFVVPRYPKSAWERGQSGAVCIEFGLDSAGAPKDLVVFGFTANMFVQPALAALSQWKYPPPSAIELDEHNRFRAQIVFVCCRGTGILIKVGR
jgi:hypothetical protein